MLHGSVLNRVGAVIAGATLAGAVIVAGPAIGSAAPRDVPRCSAPTAPPDQVIQTILDRTNADRATAGLPALEWNPHLWCLARAWSQHLGERGAFQHRDLEAAIRSQTYRSYRTIGENILRGPRLTAADEMEKAWMASPTHRANILSPEYSSLAIASYDTTDGSKVYVTENFAG